jgi:cytochrome c-type biogenesis protein CcmE
MTPRHRRLLAIVVVVAGVGIATTLALRAFRENLLYFYTPTQILSGEAPAGRKIRLGGLVTKGSVHRAPGQLEVRFEVTDLAKAVNVSYTGVLPDLFRDGQGVIAHGVMGADGTFVADEVLAKHDENYMPPEVAQSLKDKGHPGTPPAVPPATEGPR